MKTLWLFGDSFTAPGNQRGWGYYLSKKLNYNFKHKGISGASNYQILFNLVRNLSYIKENDLIVINWSFLTRGTLFSTDGMISSNRFYFDEEKSWNKLNNLENSEIHIKNNNIDILNYIIDNSIQENSMVFTLAKAIQDYLETKNINVYSNFLEKGWLTHNGKKLPWPEDNFGLNNLNFEPDYFTWLDSNNYLGDSDLDTHYKVGISHIIGQAYLDRITPKRDIYII